MRRSITVLAIWAACAPAAAQTVYKCSDRGKVSYGERPCATGAQSTLEVPAAPPPDPELEKRLARQKALLGAIEKERRAAAAQEAREARAALRAKAREPSPRKQRCDKLRLQLKWAEEDLRKAAGPGTEALRLKAQRQAEAAAVECGP